MLIIRQVPLRHQPLEQSDFLLDILDIVVRCVEIYNLQSDDLIRLSMFALVYSAVGTFTDDILLLEEGVGFGGLSGWRIDLSKEFLFLWSESENVHGRVSGRHLGTRLRMPR